MNKTLAYVAAAAAVVAIAAIGFGAFGGFGGTNLGGQPSVEPSVAETTPTPEPSVAEPTSSADSFLPEGPHLVWQSPSEDAPSITMTIPEPEWIYVAEFSGLVKGEDVGNLPEAWVLPGSFPPGTGFIVYGDPCQWQSTTPQTPATTVDEIIAALAAQASRDASEPVDVMVGGHAGKMITLHVPDDADFADCDQGEFVSYGSEQEAVLHWHQGPGQTDDFWFFDVAGSIVTIRTTYLPDNAELFDEIQAIVESSVFEFP